MGKCTCPTCKRAAKNTKAGCGKKKGHPANMFILFYLDYWKKNGGNMYCVAKECGQKWKALPQSQKDKYKRQYCTKCKNCKSCTRKPKC